MSNPNPSPATRFGAGNNANPQGRTSEQRKLEIANAERATRIRAILLASIEALVERAEGDMPLSADLMRLLKDAEDRGLGQPVAHAEVTHRYAEMSDEALDAEIASLVPDFGAAAAAVKH